MTTTKTTLVVCSNTEWLRENAGLNLDLLADGRENEAADALGSELDARLRDAGFAVDHARGQHATYHGWNGANTFAHKLGAAGTFDDLTSAQQDEILSIQSAVAKEIVARFSE